MIPSEIIDILNTNRPIKPQTLNNKKLQRAIDAAVEVITTYDNIISQATISFDDINIVRLNSQWVKNANTFWTCNNCNWVNDKTREQYNFCPNCGASMRRNS